MVNIKIEGVREDFMINFLKSVKEELGKVTWLSSEEVWEKFFYVIVVVVILVLYFGIIDLIVAWVKKF